MSGVIRESGAPGGFGGKAAGKEETMVLNVELSPADREILVDVIDTCLSDLRMEIAHTDRQEFREQLKRRKEVLQKVLDRLV